MKKLTKDQPNCLARNGSLYLHFVAAILFLSLFLSNLYFSMSWNPPGTEEIIKQAGAEMCQAQVKLG